ncbi:methylated-DNA--[protein]-cysteine S-methyltransferase [Methanobacterium congolense]|uniref:methylated-DNA--[protein]-cysteine S-methyltransferase n=1 Tax=Methanobacterium congolense TaxID=118062 RepID=A0A1D3L464_9EURY|nr:MGMT family protein [Methanobacterium congolense]SCG86363.1 Methylated-DNA-protein-cysteine methyltransferase [Methanobacterium congolense]
MVKKREDPIEVSTYQSGMLHFAVGVSDSGKIVRITLPCETEEEVLAEISREHPDFEVTDDHVDLAKTVSDAYHGKKVKFNLNALELGFSSEVEDSTSECLPVTSSFERRVLLEVSKIPFGEVTTYKKISESLGTRGYRAVGTAIGKNPFPIIIPCHRVVKSDGHIGNYRGGVRMKREILKNEGIEIRDDRIII